MSPMTSNQMPVTHGVALFQQIFDLVSRSLKDAEAHPETYSAKYAASLRKLADATERAGAKTPEERLAAADEGADEAAFSDPAHRRLLRQTAVGRFHDDERRKQG